MKRSQRILLLLSMVAMLCVPSLSRADGHSGSAPPTTDKPTSTGSSSPSTETPGTTETKNEDSEAVKSAFKSLGLDDEKIKTFNLDPSAARRQLINLVKNGPGLKNENLKEINGKLRDFLAALPEDKLESFVCRIDKKADVSQKKNILRWPSSLVAAAQSPKKTELLKTLTDSGAIKISLQESMVEIKDRLGEDSPAKKKALEEIEALLKPQFVEKGLRAAGPDVQEIRKVLVQHGIGSLNSNLHETMEGLETLHFGADTELGRRVKLSFLPTELIEARRKSLTDEGVLLPQLRDVLNQKATPKRTEALASALGPSLPLKLDNQHKVVVDEEMLRKLEIPKALGGNEESAFSEQQMKDLVNLVNERLKEMPALKDGADPKKAFSQMEALRKSIREGKPAGPALTELAKSLKLPIEENGHSSPVRTWGPALDGVLQSLGLEPTGGTEARNKAVLQTKESFQASEKELLARLPGLQKVTSYHEKSKINEHLRTLRNAKSPLETREAALALLDLGDQKHESGRALQEDLERLGFEVGTGPAAKRSELALNDTKKFLAERSDLSKVLGPHELKRFESLDSTTQAELVEKLHRAKPEDAAKALPILLDSFRLGRATGYKSAKLASPLKEAAEAFTKASKAAKDSDFSTLQAMAAEKSDIRRAEANHQASLLLAKDDNGVARGLSTHLSAALSKTDALAAQKEIADAVASSDKTRVQTALQNLLAKIEKSGMTKEAIAHAADEIWNEKSSSANPVRDVTALALANYSRKASWVYDRASGTWKNAVRSSGNTQPPQFDTEIASAVIAAPGVAKSITLSPREAPALAEAPPVPPRTGPVVETAKGGTVAGPAVTTTQGEAPPLKDREVTFNASNSNYGWDFKVKVTSAGTKDGDKQIYTAEYTDVYGRRVPDGQVVRAADGTLSFREGQTRDGMSTDLANKRILFSDPNQPNRKFWVNVGSQGKDSTFDAQHEYYGDNQVGQAKLTMGTDGRLRFTEPLTGASGAGTATTTLATQSTSQSNGGGVQFQYGNSYYWAPGSGQAATYQWNGAGWVALNPTSQGASSAQTSQTYRNPSQGTARRSTAPVPQRTAGITGANWDTLRRR